MNQLDEIHERMTGEGPKDTHICVNCGNLVSKCTCDPSGKAEYETDRVFRQMVKDKLKIIEGDVSSIRQMLEDIYDNLP